MKGFNANIEKLTLDNDYFRQVLYTNKRSQLVLMCLQVGEDIGLEVHPDNDQFFRFEAGTGVVYIDGNEYEVSDGSAVVIPAGAQHNVTNIGNGKLKMYTIYSPAHHKDGVVNKTKDDAMKNDADFDGITSE